ncbi:adenosylcobinamide amidohydrolase [Thermodesulforhabdus norvegica]|uniref:ABC-type Fe3+-hydroxamate transport system, substrate-binding protein n=1 Tax=Thermodesulforhabdus norvegica TaxID=39841 RepID=A0A1I4QXH3_9BACT|nr:adenosylcobinamide amidohydrolase [Thermodesulforhabdus norvegica]SFM44707.1 ABC-type Fe3+-hydroxamate transport system, substrate-binding protein [Thermodesulforhabdus norvegica]
MKPGKLAVTCLLFLLFVPLPLSALQHDDQRFRKDLISPEELGAGVVSLDSSVTEIILALGAGQLLRGVTIHDLDVVRRFMARPPEGLAVVGSFFAPDIKKIAGIFEKGRGVIFVHDYHQSIGKELSRYGRVLKLSINGPEDLYEAIRTLGFVLKREEKAEGLVADIKGQIEIISRKAARIPPDRRKRVLRFMGRKDSDSVYVPGDDSFQNLFIRLAGGIPPSFGKKGPMVAVTVDEWRRFNPQVIYGCGGDREVAEKFFGLPGWKDVEAVKEGKIYYFPCDLTCRFSIHSGLFVQWLASTIYEEEFSDLKNLVKEEKILRRRSIAPALELDYVVSAEIVDSRIYDFHHKTLLIRFKEPLDIISTLEGPRRGIQIVGNNFSPPPCWNINHDLGFDAVKKHIFEVLELDPGKASLLYTGADMDNLSVQKASSGSLLVYALATAGVRGNALRTSRDEGSYEEPGTINVIIMTNRRLSPGAMSRAVITATEAKTAALQDLDVRSTCNPLRWQATGTGTDEIIVVSGKGPGANLAGGHTRLGQLIADAVYRAVLDAIRRQNGITPERTIAERLEERGIELYRLLSLPCGICSETRTNAVVMTRLYELLLSKPYTSFMNTAFAVSDLYEKGLIKDLSFFKKICEAMAPSMICRECSLPEDAFPAASEPLRMALEALLKCALSSSCWQNYAFTLKEVAR